VGFFLFPFLKITNHRSPITNNKYNSPARSPDLLSVIGDLIFVIFKQYPALSYPSTPLLLYPWPRRGKGMQEIFPLPLPENNKSQITDLK
jgi:hypothetical protein